MDEFIKTLHSLILKHTQHIEESNILETKSLTQKLVSLRNDRKIFVSRQELENKKQVLTIQKADLEEKKNTLQRNQEQKAQEQREREEQQRLAIQQKNQEWLTRCQNKIEKVKHIELQKRIQDVNLWLFQDQNMQNFFNAPTIEEVSLKKLHSIQPEMKKIQQAASAKIDAIFETHLNKKRSQKDTLRQRKSVENLLQSQHQTQEKLLQELQDYGVEKSVIDALMDMDQGAESYFTEQIIETFHSNLALEKNWNQNSSPIHELENHQPE